MEDLIVDVQFVEEIGKGLEMDYLFGTSIGLFDDYLEVDSLNSKKKTEKQVTLHEWIKKVGIQFIGDYFIDVKNNYYVETSNWTPSTHLGYCEGSIEDFRISFSYVHDDDQVACVAIIYHDMVREHCKNHNLPKDATVTAEAPTICEAICKSVIKYKHGFHDGEMV